MVSTQDVFFQIITGVSGIGVNAALALVASWFLPMRRRALFFCCMLVLPIAALFVASPVTMTLGNIGGYLINYIVLPCLFWEGPLPIRIVCGFLLIASEFVVETFAGIVLSLAGVPLDRDSGSLVLLLVRLAGVLIILIVGRLMAHIVARTIGGDAGARVVFRGLQRSAIWRYALFLIPQLVFFAAAIMTLMKFRDTAPQTFAIFLLAVIVCLAANAIALFSFGRCIAARRDSLRAEALERQLVLNMEHARLCDVEAKRAARFRHDQRNHLQTVLGLIERGQTERAETYVRELRREISRKGGAE